MGLLDQSLVTLTSLQEDPMLQQIETKALELQKAYDTVWGNAQTVTITQWLARMREAHALKEQLEAAQ